MVRRPGREMQTHLVRRLPSCNPPTKIITPPQRMYPALSMWKSINAMWQRPLHTADHPLLDGQIRALPGHEIRLMPLRGVERGMPGGDGGTPPVLDDQMLIPRGKYMLDGSWCLEKTRNRQGKSMLHSSHDFLHALLLRLVAHSCLKVPSTTVVQLRCHPIR